MGTLDIAVAAAGPDQQRAFVLQPAAPPGQQVTFHLWVPPGCQVAGVQPYVQQGEHGRWQWTGHYVPLSMLHCGEWNTLTVTVPSNAVMPLREMGLQIVTDRPWTGDLVLGSVRW